MTQIDEEAKIEIAELKHKVDILVQEGVVKDAEIRLLKERVNRFEAHVQRVIEMEKRIDERLQAQNRIEWQKS